MTFEKLLKDGEGGAVRRVLRRAQAVDPAARYASVEQLACALRREDFLRRGTLFLLVLLLAGGAIWYKVQEPPVLPEMQENVPAASEEVMQEEEEAEAEVAKGKTAEPGALKSGAAEKDAPKPNAEPQKKERHIYRPSGEKEDETLASSPDWHETLGIEARCLWCGNLHNHVGAIVFQPEEALPDPGSYENDLISPDTWNAGFRITNNSAAPLRHLRLEMRTFEWSGDKRVEVQGPAELAPGESTDIIVPLGGYRIDGNLRIGCRDFDLSLYADSFERRIASWSVSVFTEKRQKSETSL